MPRNIDYYFSLHSPWAYIGHIPFMEIVRSHNVKVTCKPISLTNVFAETGGLPVAKRHPARLRYRILELQRWREKRGLKFNLHPKFWPLNVEIADQGRYCDRSHRFTKLCARRGGILGPGSARSSGRRAPVRTQALSLRRMRNEAIIPTMRGRNLLISC